MSSIVEWITGPLELDFMLRALLVATVCGVTCAVISCWITLLGWSLMGDAVSHAVLPGVVIAYIAGIPFAIGALLFGSLAVAGIGVVSRTSRIKEDAAIGVIFTGLFALGVLLVSVVPSQIDLMHILFGNVLGVSSSEIWQTIGIGVVTMSVLIWKRKDLTLYAFDPVHAHAIGISPKRLEFLLLGSLALAVVVALQAVGIVLVVAMLITPGATAYLLTDKFDRMLVIASAASVLSCVLGTYLSFHLDASPGAAIVCALSLIFLIAYLFGPKSALQTSRRKRKSASTVRTV